MVKLQLISGTVYTEYPVDQLRIMLQGGSKTGTVKGYTDETKATPILIAIQAIEYIFE